MKTLNKLVDTMKALAAGFRNTTSEGDPTEFGWVAEDHHTAPGYKMLVRDDGTQLILNEHEYALVMSLNLGRWYVLTSEEILERLRALIELENKWMAEDQDVQP